MSSRLLLHPLPPRRTSTTFESTSCHPPSLLASLALFLSPFLPVPTYLPTYLPTSVPPLHRLPCLPLLFMSLSSRAEFIPPANYPRARLRYRPLHLRRPCSPPPPPNFVWFFPCLCFSVPALSFAFVLSAHFTR